MNIINNNFIDKTNKANAKITNINEISFQNLKENLNKEEYGNERKCDSLSEENESSILESKKINSVLNKEYKSNIIKSLNNLLSTKQEDFPLSAFNENI